MADPETPPPDRDEKRILLAVAVLMILAAPAIALVVRPSGGGAPCVAEAACDCEAPRSGPVSQSANAWSSLALGVAGLAVLARAQRHRELPAGLALTAAGAASFLYHSTLTGWSARLDGAGVAAAVAGLASAAWDRRLHLSIADAGVAASAGAGYWLRPPALHWLTGGLALLALVGYLGSHGLRGGRSLAWSAAAAAGGGAFWILGRSGAPWCRAESLLQAHAAWHVLIAAAAYLLLSHLRADPSRIPRTPDPL